MITIDVRWLNASGIGTYIRNIVPGVIRELSGQRFTLLGNLAEIDSLDLVNPDRVQCISARSGMYSIAEQFEILRIIPKESSLYFSPHYPIPFRYGPRHGKLLVTVHDVIHLANPQWFGGLHKQFYAKAMMQTVANRADAIIAVSEFTKSELNKYASVDVNKIHTIYNGVDQSWFEKTTLPSPHQKPYLLFVGNVKPHKNLANLVRAFGQIMNKVPYDLVIVGRQEGFRSGDMEAQQLAQSHPSRILFTGFVDDGLLKSYMSHASAFIFPSLYEGFGLPPLEAMAAHVPTLVSNAAPMPEVCGNASMYFDPRNPGDIAAKILELISHPQMQEKLKENGLIRAKMFSWDAAIEKTARLAHQLVSNK